VTTSHSAAHAAAQPGRPARMNATVPKTAQARPQRLSQKRIRWRTVRTAFRGKQLNEDGNPLIDLV